MSKLVVQAIKFVTPVPELLPKIGHSTFLGPEIKGWSAIANQELREIVLKVRKFDQAAQKTKTHTYRLPFESVQFYQATSAAVTGDEPADPA